jgi:Fe-S-cluster containining protein
VFLSESDVARLVAALALEQAEFEAAYCRWVAAGAVERLSLKERREKAGYDCIFWKDGCSVYESRPLQCRIFPFWRMVMADAASWRRVAADCPGMGAGILHPADEIEAFLEQERKNAIIIRKTDFSLQG